MAEFKKIAVIGSGTMGNGIAQVCAMAGFDVVMNDIEQRFVDNGMKAIEKSLGKMVEKQKMTKENADSVKMRITPTIKLEDCKDADLVVEAIFENLQVKCELFQKLDAMCPPSTILSSNTSSISITRMAAATKRPDKFIGMHFMNPVPMMKLVEIINGLKTSPETCKAIMELSVKLGKTPIEVNDFPGFASNRILMPMINEAIFCVHEGVGTPQNIDEVMKLGMNHPMGPLALADLIGLDIVLHIMEVLYEGFNDSKYRPCPLLRKMVAAGKLGRKTGEGFYKY